MGNSVYCKKMVYSRKFSKLETHNIMSAKVNRDVCALYAHIVRNTFFPTLFCRIPVNLLGFFNMHAERFLTEFFFNDRQY